MVWNCSVVFESSFRIWTPFSCLFWDLTLCFPSRFGLVFSRDTRKDFGTVFFKSGRRSAGAAAADCSWSLGKILKLLHWWIVSKTRTMAPVDRLYYATLKAAIIPGWFSWVQIRVRAWRPSWRKHKHSTPGTHKDPPDNIWHGGISNCSKVSSDFVFL